MPLDNQSLVRVSSAPYAAGETKSIYFYPTGDTVATCLGSGYFNGASKRLRKGDLIQISAVNGGTPTCSLCVVTSASAATPVTTAAAIFT